MIIDRKEFFRWLETASEEELRIRLEALRAALEVVREEGVRYEVRYLLRNIEEELVSRLL